MNQRNESYKKKSNLVSTLKMIYKCSVCLSLPTTKILQCKEGHIICDPCYKRLHHLQSRMNNTLLCPTCKNPYPTIPIRCRSAEQALAQIDLKHIECPHCPKKINIHFLDVVDHFKKKHQVKKHDIALYEQLRWSVSWPLRLNKSATMIVEQEKKFFLLRAILHKNTLYVYVNMLGNKEEARRFQVRIELSPEDKNDTTIIARRKVYSADMTKSNILQEPSNALKVTKSMAEDLTSIKDERRVLYIDFEILPLY